MISRILCLLLAFSPAAYADFASLLADKHWENVEETDPFLQTTVCRARTTRSNSAETLELSLAYPKDGKALPMITVKTKLSASVPKIHLSSRESAALFPLQANATPDGATLYWYAPVDFPGLEQFIRAKSKLAVHLGETAVEVSLSGSSNSVEAAKKCLGETKVPTAFLKLLNQEKQNLSPDLGDRSPLALWQATEQAYSAYQAGVRIQAALDVLRKPYASLLKKEGSAQKEFQAAFAAHQKASQAVEVTRANIGKFEAEINTRKAALAQMQADKPQAEADLKAKKAAYLPLKEQMKPYDAKLSASQKAADTGAAEVAKQEKLIEEHLHDIPLMEAEREELTRSLPGLEAEYARQKRAYDIAERNYQAYDTAREIQRILNNSSEYGSAQRDKSDAEWDLSRARSDLSSAESDLSRARSSLDSCKAQPDSNCFSEEWAVQRAESAVNDAQSKVRSAESELSDAESRMRSIEWDAQRRVQARDAELRQIRDTHYSRMSKAKSRLTGAQKRIAQIERDIPRYRAEIAEAEAALPALREKAAALQAELAKVAAERNAFSEQIGFGKAEEAYSAAQSRLDGIVKGIAENKKLLPALEKSLARAKKDLPSLEKSEGRRLAELTRAEAALKGIQEQLKPLREQEAPLAAELRRESERFETNRAAYQDLYRLLLESGGAA